MEKKDIPKGLLTKIARKWKAKRLTVNDKGRLVRKTGVTNAYITRLLQKKDPVLMTMIEKEIKQQKKETEK